MNGNHAGGAARLAVEKFGAIMGKAKGIQGQSYAIPTLDKDMQKVTEEELLVFLENFRNYANEHPEKEFLLTAIGTGIAGFDASYMAYMVLRANLPDNVTLPKEFVKIKGDQGAASATGNQGAASATGKDSIALAAGYGCKAKGAIGCWIVLAERGEWNGDTYPIKEVKAFEVDGKKVKADTWYMLVNGQLKEV